MTDTTVLEKPETIELPFTRRFERPDIDKHAAWFVPRLLKVYPQLTARSTQTWLLSILESNEFMFLYQDHAIGLAQVCAYSLRPEAIIEEIFVWCENPQNKENQQQAAHFYDHFYQWAKRKGIATMTVQENSDVPPELIRKQLGSDEQSKRLFERKVMYARIA